MGTRRHIQCNGSDRPEIDSAYSECFPSWWP